MQSHSPDLCMTGTRFSISRYETRRGWKVTVADAEWSDGVVSDLDELSARVEESVDALLFSDCKSRTARSRCFPMSSEGFETIEPHPCSPYENNIIDELGSGGMVTKNRSWAYLEASEEQVYGGNRSHRETWEILRPRRRAVLACI